MIDYLGRHTHPVAISNHRLLVLPDDHDTFQYKDYRARDPQQSRQMRLPAEGFLRRFLLHVIPPGFQRIRHYGLFSNRFRARSLARCRALLAGERSELLPLPQQIHNVHNAIVETASRCPRCKTDSLQRVLVIPAIRWSLVAAAAPPTDTS